MHALILGTRMRLRIERTSGTLRTTGSLRVFFGRMVLRHSSRRLSVTSKRNLMA